MEKLIRILGVRKSPLCTPCSRQHECIVDIAYAYFYSNFSRAVCVQLHNSACSRARRCLRPRPLKRGIRTANRVRTENRIINIAWVQCIIHGALWRFEAGQEESRRRCRSTRSDGTAVHKSTRPFLVFGARYGRRDTALRRMQR